MNASRLSHLEALARVLSSNDPDAINHAKELNAVVRFIQDTFLSDTGGIEAELRAERADHENPRPDDPAEGHYMKLDGLPDEPLEGTFDA